MALSPEKEVVQRLRRIETRLGRYFDHVGFDCGMRKPVWDGERVQLSSLDASLKDIINVIPAVKREEDIDLMHDGKVIANIYVGGE